ncbi:hypothetical protein CPB85DRAFT_812394 [Mucidula mucida]|nr:hypothetical protein CPB85DRAFT_812394 [Mucidula mucida]
MSVDDVVKSEKDNMGSDSPSPKCLFTFQTPVRPQSQRQSTPGASSSVARRVFNFNEGSPNPGRTTPERESETINNSDSVNEPRTPVRSRPRHYNHNSVTSDDEDVHVKSVSPKRKRHTEEAEFKFPKKRNKGKGKMKNIDFSRIPKDRY